MVILSTIGTIELQGAGAELAPSRSTPRTLARLGAAATELSREAIDAIKAVAQQVTSIAMRGRHGCGSRAGPKSNKLSPSRW
jgi:hypothetical protein